MAKFCSKCGTEVEDNVSFCPSCGEKIGSVSTNVVNSNEKKSILDKFNEMSGLHKVCACAGVLLVLFLLVALFSGGGGNTPDSTIEVNDLSIANEGYGLYKVTGTLVPDKDYDYLEMVVVFYDSDGTIVEKDPLAWNMNDINANQNIKLSGSAFVDSSENPAKAEVYFFDSVFSGGDLDNAIYSQSLDL